MPKGVVGRHTDMREAQLDAQRLLAPVLDSLDEAVAMIRTDGPGRMTLPACLLMHGTGLITAIGNLASGGCLVTPDNPFLDAFELWDALDRSQVQAIGIVGAAFRKPMPQVLAETHDLCKRSTL